MLSRGRAVVLALLAGLIGSAALVWTGSDAAFSGVTGTPVNTWSAGSVQLTDDAAGSAMFTTSAPGTGQVSGAGMKPGRSVVNCLRVTYTGTAAATVRLYVASVSGGLPPYLHVKVEEGLAGAFGCSGFSGASTLWDTSTHPGVASDLLSVFPTTYAAGAQSGLASWTQNSFRVYRFTVTLDASVPDASQSATAQTTFTWQAQNT